MKASEFLMAKALEYDDFRLTKAASELHGTEKDIDFIIKDAGILNGALVTAGKSLLENKVVRNAAIGTGVGAVAGAAKAGDGNRMQGALKGGLIGGVLGGGATYGKQVFNTYKNLQIAAPNAGTGNLVRQAFRATGDAGIRNDVGNAIKSYRASKGTLSLPTLGSK